MPKLRQPNRLMNIWKMVGVKAAPSVRIIRRAFVTILLAFPIVASCDVYGDLKATRIVREKVHAEFGVTPTVAFRSFKPVDATASIDAVTVRLPPTPRHNREVVKQRVKAIVKEAFPTAGTINLIEVSNSIDTPSQK